MNQMCFAARYEYAVACLPLWETYSFPECYMTLLTNVTSFVEISTVNETTTMTLTAGTLYREDFTLNPTQGTEAKAIHVTSDEPLLVVVYRGDSWDSDAYQIPPLQEDSNDFLTTAYISNENSCFSEDYKEFYLVVNFYNDTFISIQQQDGVRYDLVLSEYELFSQKTLSATDRLACGTRIRSSNPIAVISGNLCIRNHRSYGAYASTIPPLKSLGDRYVLPNIASDSTNPEGFSASVVATENNTAVESEGDVRYLDEGETAIFEYLYQDRSVVVNCSRVCLVAQYSKSWSSYHQGLFMLHGVPEDMFQMSAYLSSLAVTFPTFLSLIVQGEEPGQDIYLNGDSLVYLNWTAIDGFTSAELSIPSGNHELQSVNGRPFAVFVYGHDSSDTGAGYTYYPITTPITPSPTTPTPTPPMDTYPEHTARVTGTAVTADGLPQTPQCALVSTRHSALYTEISSLCMVSLKPVD